MKALVVYESTWGNTEKIAQAIAAGLAGGTRALHLKNAGAEELDEIDLLVIGSPVNNGRPSPSMQTYLKSVKPETAAKLKVAAFDTRLRSRLATMLGNAASRIAAQFKELGSNVIATPEGFIVKGQKGPLADGEIDRAARWGKDLTRLGA
jgi:flavodoxin I